MKFITLKILAIFFFCVHSVYAADEVIEADLFPENIAIEFKNEGINLKRTGSTIRKKFFFKIYKMAHYVDEAYSLPQNSEDVYNTILQQNYTKQISTIYLRSIKIEKIKKSLLSDIKLNTEDDEYSEMLPHIDAFMQVLTENVEENDKFVLRRFPDGTIVSLFNGKVISTIKDENFARTMWSIWFGRFSVVKRDTLVEELLTSS